MALLRRNAALTRRGQKAQTIMLILGDLIDALPSADYLLAVAAVELFLAESRELELACFRR